MAKASFSSAFLNLAQEAPICPNSAAPLSGKTKSHRGQSVKRNPLEYRAPKTLPPNMREEVRKLQIISEGQKKKLMMRRRIQYHRLKCLELDRSDALKTAKIHEKMSRKHGERAKQLSSQHAELYEQFHRALVENKRQRNLNRILLAEMVAMESVSLPGLMNNESHDMPRADRIENACSTEEESITGSLESSSQVSMSSLGKSEMPKRSEHIMKSNAISVLWKHNHALAKRVMSLEEENLDTTRKLEIAERSLRAISNESMNIKNSQNIFGDRRAQTKNGKMVSEETIHRHERKLHANALMDLPNTSLAVQNADLSLVELIQSGSVDKCDILMRLRQLQAIQISTALQGATVDPLIGAVEVLVSTDVCKLFDVEAVNFYGIKHTDIGNNYIWNISPDNSKIATVLPRNNELVQLAKEGGIRQLQGENEIGALNSTFFGVPSIQNALLIPFLGQISKVSETTPSRVLGFLLLANKKPTGIDFNPIDQILATLLSGYVGYSLMSIDHVATTNMRSHTLLRIMEKKKEYKILMSSTGERGTVQSLSSLTQHARTTLRAQAVQFFFKTMHVRKDKIESNSMTKRVYAVRIYIEVLPEINRSVLIETAIQDSIAGRVVQSGLPQHVSLIDSDSYFNPSVDLVPSGRSSGLVTVPLTLLKNGEIIGVMQLEPSCNIPSQSPQGWCTMKPLSCIEAALFYVEAMEDEILKTYELISKA